MAGAKAKAGSLLDLAIKNIKKSDGEKAIENVNRSVADAEHNWGNEIHGLKKDVQNAEDAIDALKANVDASCAQCLTASRNLALAKKNLADAEELMAARF